MANMSTTINLPDGSGRITVEALAGTQTISRFTGPTDATDPGSVLITLTGKDRRETGILIVGTQIDYIRVLRRALDAAWNVAFSRDHSRDQPYDQPRTGVAPDAPMIDVNDLTDISEVVK